MSEKIEQDIGRFRDIIRGRIKKELRKFITSSELIGKKGKELVSIPVPQIDIPHFIYGDKQKGGVGQGEGDIGTPLGKGDDKADGSQAGNLPGEHLLEVEISFEELAEILGEELELPKIKPKGQNDITSNRVKYTSIGLSGPESLKHFKRTYKQALKRQIMSGTYDSKRPVIIPVREDRRYRMWKDERKPETKAVIIYMMDVSGCHTKGHYVEMADGSYKDVSDVVVGDKVACMDVEARNKTTSIVLETFQYDVNETISIQTEDHVSLDVTPKHRYFVYDEANNIILEKEAGNIKEGDLLILVNQFGKGSSSLTSKDISEAEGYLFGVILGDGYVNFHIDEADSQKNSRYVMITDENVNRLNYYADCAHTAFGIKGLIHNSDGRNRLFLNSVELVERIRKEMFSLCERSRHRYIEPLIFRQKPSVRAAFLRGLFDAEGTLATHAVEMLSSSLALVKQVKFLLSFWGIRARITKYEQEDRFIKDSPVKGDEYFRLIINSKDAVIFAKKVGFGCKEKMEKLDKLVSQQENGIDAMRSRYIPICNIKDLLDDIPSMEKIKSRLYEDGRNAYSRANLERMMACANKTEQKDFIELTLQRSLLVCKVKQVEHVKGSSVVYDFTVDKHNNYIVDGILSHNSMGQEQKEIVRLEAFWIDTWLKSQYKNIETRYIIHDAVAREVDRETFFHTRESGGTIISSAYKLCLKMLEEKYNPSVWNIYPFHFSDGDNWSGNDTDECIKLLREQLLPASNIFCYGQVESEYGSGQFIKDLQEHMTGVDNLITSKIENKEAIVKSIKEFLGKGK